MLIASYRRLRVQSQVSRLALRSDQRRASLDTVMADTPLRTAAARCE